ncbi:MAG: dihydroorotase [Lachnospiraceae bacterium]|nr:dihydroorotase [Lachnospiraceae bacterium]
MTDGLRKLFENARIIDPASGLDIEGSILIRDDRIEKIAASSEMDEYVGSGEVSRIDVSGMIIAPGLVDTHVHFRDPGFTEKEDINTGAAAAKAGGYTSVVMMANTKPSVDSVETLKYMLDKGAQTGIKVYACGNVTMGMAGRELTDMTTLREAGAVGFTDDGLPLLDEKLTAEAMRKCRELNVPISFHEEDPQYISQNGVNHGKASNHFGIEGSDRKAEISMIERDIRLARETGAKVVVQHISTAEGVDLVRRAKAEGLDVHAEATPHHFSLTEDAVIEHGTLAKMNPPLRTEEDRQAIIAGLKDGSIDMIATDHAPHTAEEKSRELTKAPSGIIGLETALSLGITELVDKGYMTLSELLMRMTAGPADVYSMDAGRLCEGGAADIVVFDANVSRKVPAVFASKAQNSPFIGREVSGKILYTVCNGNTVFEGR